MLQILLDLASRGILADVLASFLGGARREAQPAKEKLGLYNILAMGMAAVLLLIALGFLVAAGYMQLTTVFVPPLAAVLTAAGLILVALGVLLLAKPRDKKQPVPEPQQPEQPAEGPEVFIRPFLSAAHNIFDFAKKNPDILAGVALMVGVWLSMGGDDKEDDNDRHKDGDKGQDKSDNTTE